MVVCREGRDDVVTEWNSFWCKKRNARGVMGFRQHRLRLLLMLYVVCFGWNRLYRPYQYRYYIALRIEGVL